jgi:hypothetical protein
LLIKIYILEITAKDCEDYQVIDDNFVEGIYKIRIGGSVLEVFCTADGFTVIQSRGQFNFSKDFFSSKTWEDYQHGFGELGIIIILIENRKCQQTKLHLSKKLYSTVCGKIQ